MPEKIRWNRRHQLGHTRADGELVIIPSAGGNNNFFYLTGIREPNAVLVLFHGEEILFCEGGCSAYPEIEIEDIQPLENLEETVVSFIADCEEIYFPITENQQWDRRILGWIKQVLKKREMEYLDTPDIKDVRKHLNVMRLRKDPIEIDAIRGASKVVQEKHEGAFKTQSGIYSAYGKCNGYWAKATRTLPKKDAFSSEESTLYEIVLAAQHRAIEKVQTGLTIADAHREKVRALSEGLFRLGIATDADAIDFAILTHCGPKTSPSNPLKRFFADNTIMWIGLDSCDPCDYFIEGKPRMLEAGMTMSVKSSLIIPGDAEDINQQWRGIQICISDTVLVTNNGPDVLTDSVPR